MKVITPEQQKQMQEINERYKNLRMEMIDLIGKLADQLEYLDEDLSEEELKHRMKNIMVTIAFALTHIDAHLFGVSASEEAKKGIFESLNVLREVYEFDIKDQIAALKKHSDEVIQRSKVQFDEKKSFFKFW